MPELTWQDPKWFDEKKPHTHRFSKRLPDSDVVECQDCGHPFGRHTIEADRREAAQA